MWGMALTNHLHLAMRLKKQSSYTPTPPPGLHGLLVGKPYLHLYLRIYFNEPFIFKRNAYAITHLQLA
jgi:hypothetical protein